MVNYYDKHLFISKTFHPKPRNFPHRPSNTSVRTTASTSPQNSKTRRPSANPPFATSSSNPGKTNNSTSKPATTYDNISHQNHESAKT